MSPFEIAFTVVVIGSAVVLPACGGSSSATSALPDGGGSGDASNSQAAEGSTSFTLATVASPECITLGTVMCERLATCSPETFAAYDGAPRCIRELAYECPLGRSGNLATSADVAACADAYAALECRDVIEGNSPRACDPVTHGTREELAPCALDGECSSGHCAGRANGYSCGQCEDIPVLGEPCGFYDAFCGPHSSCGADRTCRPVAGADAPCCGPFPYGPPCDSAEQGNCEKDLQCAGGKCEPRLEAGAACDTTPYGCKSGLYCHHVSATCAALRVVDQGPCGLDLVSGEAVGCRVGSLCRALNGPMAASGEGVCSPLREEGQPCGEDGIKWDIGEGYTDPTPCRAPAVCINGTCVVAYLCP